MYVEEKRMIYVLVGVSGQWPVVWRRDACVSEAAGGVSALPPRVGARGGAGRGAGGGAGARPLRPARPQALPAHARRAAARRPLAATAAPSTTSAHLYIRVN